MYTRVLKVSTPEGERVSAFINRTGENVLIKIKYLSVVEKDNPPFAQKGIIKISCEIHRYMDTIKLLTKYLEDLFLKGMADEDIYTSLGGKAKFRRVKRKDTKRKIGNSKRKRSTTSVLSGSGRNESSESTGGGYTNPEVAEIRDPSTGGEDKNWD